MFACFYGIYKSENFVVCLKKCENNNLICSISSISFSEYSHGFSNSFSFYFIVSNEILPSLN